MSPQPTAPPKSDAPKVDAPTTPQGNARSDDPLAGAVGALLDIATKLQSEKSDLLGRIGANRDTLRNLAKQGAGTDEQRKRIADLYPERKKGEKS